MSDESRTLIRPGQLEFARGEYDRRRADELKRERAHRAAQLEAAQRTLDKLDLEILHDARVPVATGDGVAPVSHVRGHGRSLFGHGRSPRCLFFA
jgi:hypothetical protein